MEGTKIRGWLLLILIFSAFFVFTTADYIPEHSIYNEGQLGASRLRNSLQENSGFNVSRLLVSPFIVSGESNISMITIIGSHRSYATSEIQAYTDFVSDGGVLVIFEDFGPARSIAEAMGISYFDGVLRERASEYMVNRPTQFFVRDLASQILIGVEIPIYLLVSEAAGIIDVFGMVQGETFPILATFPTTYLDVDNDNIVDANDQVLDTGYPVGLFKFYGDGVLVVVSDASIPLNQFWDRKVEIDGQLYPVPNDFWSLFLLTYLAQYVETDTIIFDESHQEVILSSGVSNLMTVIGVWVGLLNSSQTVFYLFFAIVAFAILINRKFVRDRLTMLRERRSLVQKEDPSYISNPTLAERSISEQYILYQVMEDGFIHIANTELFNMLKSTGKADEFLKEIEKEYGDINTRSSRSKLIEIHNKLRQFVEIELVKWL